MFENLGFEHPICPNGQYLPIDSTDAQVSASVRQTIGVWSVALFYDLLLTLSAYWQLFCQRLSSRPLLSPLQVRTHNFVHMVNGGLTPNSRRFFSIIILSYAKNSKEIKLNSENFFFHR